MANDKGSKRKAFMRKVVELIKVISVVILIAIVIDVVTDVIVELLSQTQESESYYNPETSGTLEMHTIDVGQADSILIRCNDEVMLVDCGTASRGDDVTKYLQDLGITKIDVLVGTHPHDDHMGGMAEVINNFDIGVLYVPNLDDLEITTNWFINFLKAVDAKDEEYNNGKSIWEFPKDENGEFRKFNLGTAVVQILAPSKDSYSNKNNYSIAMKISFGEVDIMLTGDAEALAEKEIISTGYNLESEIFKAGHHGSDTSNTEEFLEAVNPKYVIISAGFGNKYNHPIKSVMERFERNKIPVYRTDESGTIIMVTNGKDIEFNANPGDYLSGEEIVSEGMYGN